MTDIALRFSAVTKSYAGVPALVDVAFEVRRGECFALVGENGAGKTTLIKCLLDFCGLDGGTIEIFGLPHRRTQSRARLTYLPERFHPPFFLTGREFIGYFLRLHATAFDEARVFQRLRSLDLDPAALDKPVRAYSKGMTQKLGLVACLLSGKDLFVMDEPTSGLDPRARALLKREILRLRSEQRTVFFSSHALSDVAELCDRMAILHAGALRFTGTPHELLRRHGTGDLEQAFLATTTRPAAPERP